MLKQGTTGGDIFKILSDNDIEGMKKSLDEYDFDGEFGIHLALPGHQAYARCVLSMASAAACCGKLTNEMALLLFERFGSAIHLFNIARATVASRYIPSGIMPVSAPAIDVTAVFSPVPFTPIDW